MSSRKDSYTPEQWRRVWTLFHAALEIESPGRTAFLHGECQTDLQLRYEVEELLKAFEDDSNIVDRVVTLSDEVRSESMEEESEPQFQPGDVIADRFRIVSLLGKGGMGTVYEAYDLELGSSVAVKILRSQIAQQPHVLERFRNEINLARRVTHFNVCRIFDLFRDSKGFLFLTMELLQGQTLLEHLQKNGSMNEKEAQQSVEQICAALQAAHEAGVVHRDLKTSNVVLIQDNGNIRVVVTDFGLATTLSDNLTEHVLLWGTPEYMAPEQFTGEKTTPATDIYALGLMIHEMLTGQLPSSEESSSSRSHLLAEFDESWKSTILKCTQPDPNLRFQKAAEVVSSLKKDSRSRMSRPLKWSFLSLILIVISVSLVLLYVQRQSQQVRLDFQKRDWVLVCGFENKTGEGALDGTLEYALQRELSNSPFVNVVPRERVEDVLRLMRKSVDARIDATICREIVLRDGAIRASINGRVEKLGSSYSVSIQLIEPIQNATFGTLSVEAASRDEILPAVRQLSDQTRVKLGEELQQLNGNKAKLESVTTKSLEGLRLFSKADAMISAGKQTTAEALLHEAISKDPEFASAYIHLAWAIRNQQRPIKDYLSYAERGIQLSDDVSEREKYFIRGSYYHINNNFEEALKNYQVLLTMFPDHYWANSNISNVLMRLSRENETIPYIIHLADMRPNDVRLNMIAGRLVMFNGRMSEANLYLKRAVRIANGLPDEQQNRLVAEWWLDASKMHDLWLQGNVHTMLELMDRWKATLPSLSKNPEFHLLYSYLYSHYCYLGRFEQAKETVLSVPAEDLRLYYLRMIKLNQSYVDGWKNILPTYREEPSAGEALLWAHAGLQRQAQRMLAAVEKTESESADYKIAQGNIYLAQGDNAGAIAALTQGLQKRGPGMGSYFLAAESLAQAWLREGRLEMAIQILEKASQEKHKALWGKLDWMASQLQLARLYRRMGRDSEADKINAELRTLLKYAEPNFWMLEEIKK